MSQPIGVFDSGIGGLSILKALRLAMPSERLVYFADSAHNPYGEKSEGFVVERSLSIVKTLVEQHQIKALVVACNTATAAAIHVLREAYPALPIVGVEPALKPAALATRSWRVLVLATRGTLASEKFAQLKTRLEAEHRRSQRDRQRDLQFTCVPCDGLAERIEQLASSGKRWQDAPELIASCAGFMPATDQFFSKNDQKNEAFDTLVLGCTHYPLVRGLFATLVSDNVTIMDNAQPVAQRTAQLIRGLEAPSDQAGGVVWLSSGDAVQLVQAARYWGVETH
jgi:glutamate racemase